MPELPKLNPQVNINPSYGYAPRNNPDVAGGDITAAFQNLGQGAAAVAKFREDEQINAGLSAAADTHIELLGKIATVNVSTPDPVARQAALSSLAKEYTSPEVMGKLQEQFGRKGALAYQRAFQPHLLDTIGKEFAHAEVARQQIYVANVNGLAEKQRGDAVAAGYGTPGFDLGIQEMVKGIEDSNASLIPDKPGLIKKHIDQAFMATGLQLANTQPRKILDDITKSTTMGRRSLVLTINGENRNIIADPLIEQQVLSAAIHALNFQSAQADHAQSQDLKQLAAQRDQLHSNATLAILQDNPQAFYDSLGKMDEHGRLLLDGGMQQNLFTFKQTFDKFKNGGPAISDKTAYGTAVTEIENLRLRDPISIMALENLSFDDRKSLAASALALKHKMKDTDYASGRNRRKDAEDLIRGITRAKDPATAWGIVNPQAEILIAQFRSRADKEEASLTASNVSFAGYQPSQIATKLLEENSELLAKDFKQQAKTIMNTLERFIPPSGTEITFPRIHERIRDDSHLTDNEKSMFHALATQMHKQGITSQQIQTRLYGADAQDETQQTNWLSRLLQSAAQMVKP